MADNVLGTVQIVITGDTSGLAADFSRAESIAAAAGARVSSAFNSGFAGIAASSGLVDQYGRAIHTGVVEPAQAAVPALNSAGAAARTTAAALEGMGGAAQRAGFNVRYAIFGLKDLAEGRTTYALAEVVNVVSRLGPAFIGVAAGAAVALIPFASAIIKTKELTEAEKELAEATQRADEAFAQTENTLTDLTVKESAAAHGEAAGKRAEIEAMEQRAGRIRTQIQDAQDEINHIASAGAASIKNYIPILSDQNAQSTVDKIKAQGQAVRDLKEQYRELQGQIEAAKVYDLPRAEARESGGLGAIVAKGQEDAAKRAAEATLSASKARIDAAHDVRQAEIDSIQDAGDRAIASAAEKTRVAKETAAAEIAAQRAITAATVTGIQARAAAESQGKAGPEVSKIQATATNEIAAAWAEGPEKEKDATRVAYAEENREGLAYATAQRGWAEEVARVWSEQFDAIAKKRREAFEEENAPAAYNRLAAQGAQGTLDKGAGQQRDLQIQGQKIALENQYGQLILKTGAEHIAYLQQIAALDQAANTAKLTGLAADLHDAELLAEQVKGTKEYEAALKKVAELKLQIADLGQQGVNQQIQAQGQVTAARNQNNLGYQIGTDIAKTLQTSLPQALGSALANGIFNHRKGDSTGKQIGEALRGVGKNLLGEVFTQTIEKLISTVIPQVTATTANTAAIVANTAAVTGAAATSGSSGIGSFLSGVLGLISFDKGGPVSHDMIAQVHGGEWVLTKDQVAGRAPLPSELTGRGLSPVGLPSRISLPSAVPSGSSAAGSGGHTFNGPMHFYGVQNVRQMMRQIADVAKSHSPGFSPWSR
jgi:hypothetical protein